MERADTGIRLPEALSATPKSVNAAVLSEGVKGTDGIDDIFYLRLRQILMHRQ